MGHPRSWWFLIHAPPRPCCHYLVSNRNVTARSRLLILPIMGVLLFADESWRSYKIQSKISDTCFCWGGAGLDTRPLDKRYEMFGVRSLTACRALTEMNAYTDAGCGQARLTTRLLLVTALPALVVSLGIVKVFAKLGVSEVTTFIAASPPLIFAWYYFLSWSGARLIRRRYKALATDD
jgi:hypothetical protein